MEVRIIRQLLVPVTAGAELAIDKPRFLSGTFAAAVAVAATGDVVIGINRGDGQGTYTADDGASVELALPGAGIVELELADTVAELAEVSHDADGCGKTAGVGDISHALAMRGGVSGDIVPVLFFGRGTAITDVTATAAELNKLDQSAQSEIISEAGALDPAKRESQIEGPAGASYEVTLAAPTAAEVGLLKQITMITKGATQPVTMALTNVVTDTAVTSAEFDFEGGTLVLLAKRAGPTTYNWLVIKEYEVTVT